MDGSSVVWHMTGVAFGATLMLLLAGSPSVPVALPPSPTVLVVPFEVGDDLPRDLGFGVELKVLGALHAMGEVNVVHPKIRAAVLRRYPGPSAGQLPKERRQALARYLGARWLVEGSVGIRQVVLRFADAEGATLSSATVSADTLEAAIAEVPAQVLKIIEKLEPRGRSLEQPLSPSSNKPDALARLGTCYRILNRQSVGILKPPLLNERRLYQAQNRCRAALRFEPNMAAAEAGLAMAEALDGKAKAASERLLLLRYNKAFLPYERIARFWLLAKTESPEVAIIALRTAVEAQPGFLLGLSYLGDALSALGRHQESLRAYRRYLSAVPNEPYLMARAGHELARLGRFEKAVATTEKALELDPNNAYTILELSGRLIDAGQLKDAIEWLKPLSERPDATGEVHLRLGYALMETDQLDAAEVALNTALERATHPSEWRTKGRVYYDLAKIWARRRNSDRAVAALRQAIDAGFQRPDIFRVDRDFVPLRRDPRFIEVLRRTPRKPEIPERWETPFIFAGEQAARETARRTRRPGRRATLGY